MNAMKTLCAAFALSLALSSSSFAQSPFGFWNMPVAANCPGGICPPGNCTTGACATGACANGACGTTQRSNCVNGVCYQTPRLNCQNGVCTPAGGTYQIPFGATSSTSAQPTFGTANNASSPYFQAGKAIPQFGNAGYSVPISGSALTSNSNNFANRPFVPANMSGISLLPAWEQQAALNQRTCAVTGQLLGSHGKPVRTTINGQSVFVCCQDCLNQSNQFQYSSHRTQWNTARPTYQTTPVYQPNILPSANYQATQTGYAFH